MRVSASLVVKDEQSGVEFPVAQKFWEGEMFRCLGAGPRTKSVFIVTVKVYSAALYVEAERCAKELGIRYRGGFFESDDDYCQAMLDGAFNKALVVHLCRDVEGATFAEAINTALLPRCQLTGETDKLASLVQFFTAEQLKSGSEVLLYWNVAVGDLEAVIIPADAVAGGVKLDTLKPQFRLRSPGLCRALFSVYLGEATVVPEARKAWVKGAQNLLDYENVKRDTRRSGSG